jgi:hypothetical protein
MAVRDFIGCHEPDIVAMPRVRFSGIAETGNQQGNVGHGCGLSTPIFSPFSQGK